MAFVFRHFVCILTIVKQRQVPTIEEAQNTPGALLWKASKLWQNHMHGAVTGLGLSSTNVIVLSNILRLELEGKKITQASLAVLCSVDKMTVSTIVRALTAKGFIERKVIASDKRGLELSLTPEGQEVGKKALERITQAHEQFFASLGDEDVARLAEDLSKLIEARGNATK